MTLRFLLGRRFTPYLLSVLFSLTSMILLSCSSHSAKVDEALKTGNLPVAKDQVKAEGTLKTQAPAVPAKAVEPVIPVTSVAAVRAEAPEGVKIAVIDLQRVAEESAVGKNATFEYNRLAKAKQAEINEKTQAVEKLREELDARGQTLSEDVFKQKLTELDRQKTSLSRFGQDAEAELGRKYEELYSSVLKDVLSLASQIGVSENYALIIDKGSVLYCDKNVDITDSFIKKYDAFRESERSDSKTSSGE